MKVFEVIKPSHSVHKIKSTGAEFRKNLGIKNLGDYYGPYDQDAPKPKNKLVKVLGHGAYAGAIEVQGRNEIMKISRGTKDPADDPWYQYISRLASDDHIASNPWFPRVYKMKVYQTQDPAWPYFYIAFMEKLYPLTSLSEDELRSMLARFVESKLSSRIKAKFSSKYDPLTALQKLESWQLRFAVIDEVLDRATTDPLLKQALTLIKSFDKSIDINESNMMVRRTSVGPQLVLSDPLADK